MGYEDLEPDKETKIIYKEKIYTYNEILSNIDEVVESIACLELNRQSVIGLLLERSPWQIFCMMAILKSGHVYLPVNRELPEKRINYILSQADADAFIVDKYYYEKTKESAEYNAVKQINNNLIVIERKKDKKLIQEKECRTAYIIYTSGTTGRPKGVVINLRALLNLKCAMQKTFLWEKGKRILSMADYSFDMFVPEGILALSAGLTIVMSDESGIVNPRKMVKLLNKYKPQYMQIVPSALKLIMIADPCFTCLQTLDKLLIGAEKLPDSLFEKIKKFYRGQIFNLYGPTEATVWCSVANLTNERSVHIGRCLSGNSITVMNERNETASPGESGEIIISGRQLAEGYWNDKEQSKKKFFVYGYVRYYKSGDVGFIDRNGNIHCTGRKDEQVKLHGFRIELLEVENIVNRYSGIGDSVATIFETENNQMMLLFYTAIESIDSDSLISFLKKELPSYAVPSRLICVTKMEYNSNGKKDRKKMIEKYLQGGINHG